jgi:hypothetical protein
VFLICLLLKTIGLINILFKIYGVVGKLASLCLKTGHVIGISQWRPSSGRCECALCLSRDELEERLARPEADRKMEGRNRQLQRHLVCTLGQLTREQSIMARGLAKSQRAFVARQRTRSRRQSCDQDDVISSSSNSNYFRAKSSLQQQQQQQQLLDSDKHSQSSKLSLKFKNFNNGVNPHTTSDTNFNSH